MGEQEWSAKERSVLPEIGPVGLEIATVTDATPARRVKGAHASPRGVTPEQIECRDAWARIGQKRR